MLADLPARLRELADQIETEVAPEALKMAFSRLREATRGSLLVRQEITSLGPDMHTEEVFTIMLRDGQEVVRAVGNTLAGCLARVFEDMPAPPF